MRRTVACIELVVALLAASPALAQAEHKDEARWRFERGVELFDKGQPDEALIEFKRSYNIRHHYTVLYNIAQTNLMLKPPKPVDAVEAFERYLREGGRGISATRRAEVEQEIARQKAHLATLEIRGAPDGAEVRVGDRLIERAPLSTYAVSGTHTVTVTAKDREPIGLSVTVAGNDYRIIDLAPMKPTKAESSAGPAADGCPSGASDPTGQVPSQAVAPTAPLTPAGDLPVASVPPVEAKASVGEAPEQAPASHGTALRVAGLVTASVGASGLVAGTVFGLLARSRNQDALDKCPQAPCSESAKAAQSDANAFARAANIAFIAGGALATTGLVLYLVAPTERPAPKTQAYFLPFAGRDLCGIATRGTW